MMITFSVATVLSCWVVMSFEASVGCSVSFAIAACYWYKYCERIYLRFYWDPEETGWNAGTGTFDDLAEMDPSQQIEQSHNPLTKANSYLPKELANKPKKKKGFVGMIFGKGSSKNKVEAPGEQDRSRSRSGSNGSAALAGSPSVGLQRTLTNNSVSSEAPNFHLPTNLNWAATSAQRGIVMEGYLTKRGGSTQKFMDFRNEPWERRYFTLTSSASLYIYKNRHEYRNDPKSPIFTRPLRLADYYVEVNNFDYDLRENCTSEVEHQSAKSDAGGLQKSLLTLNSITVPDDTVIKPFRFQMTLILREHVDVTQEVTAHGFPSGPISPPPSRQTRYRDHWVLRCDTEEELQTWVRFMEELCPSAFQQI